MFSQARDEPEQGDDDGVEIGRKTVSMDDAALEHADPLAGPESPESPDSGPSRNKNPAFRVPRCAMILALLTPPFNPGSLHSCSESA